MSDIVKNRQLAECQYRATIKAYDTFINDIDTYKEYKSGNQSAFDTITAISANIYEDTKDFYIV